MEDTKSFLKLKEYLDGRGKLVTNPAVTKSADYTGPNPKAPVSAKADKYAGGSSKSLGGHAPYAPKLAKSQDVEKGGLAGKGKKAEPYPDPGEVDVEGKPVKSPWSKKLKAQNPYPAGSKSKMTKTESFLTKTKDMPVAEFMKYMYSECGMGMDMSGDDNNDDGDDSDLPTVTAYTAGKFHPHPPEVIKYVAALAKANPRIMEMLIHEIKRQDGLGDLVSSTMDHPETYGIMSDLFGDEDEGPSRSKALVNSMDDKYKKFMDDQDDMYESVAPPFGVSDDDDYTDEKDKDSDDDSVSDDDDYTDDDQTDDDDSQDSEDGDDQDQDDQSDDSDSDDSAPDDSDADPNADPSNATPDGSDGDIPPDGEDDSQTPPVKKKKLKKKFAHHHLINAMKDVGHMKNAMSDTVQGDAPNGGPGGM